MFLTCSRPFHEHARGHFMGMPTAVSRARILYLIMPPGECAWNKESESLEQASVKVVESCESRHRVSHVWRVKQWWTGTIVIRPESFQTPCNWQMWGGAQERHQEGWRLKVEGWSQKPHSPVKYGKRLYYHRKLIDTIIDAFNKKIIDTIWYDLRPALMGFKLCLISKS